MKINIDVKHKFKINGKEYNSVEEMPEAIREIFQKASGLQSASGYQISPDARHTRIIFNGTEYESIDAMPQDIRQLYNKVLKAAETGAAPSDIDLTGTIKGMLRVTRSHDVHSGDKLQVSKTESTFSLRAFIVSVALVTLFVVLYYLFHSK